VTRMRYWALSLIDWLQDYHASESARFHENQKSKLNKRSCETIYI
jgi:hypothetical protein